MNEVLHLPHGVLSHAAAAEGRNKPALVLCPGGGYAFCSIREGMPVARAIARQGIEAFVLRYDCEPAPIGTMPLHTLSMLYASVSTRTGSRSADFLPGHIWPGCWRRCGTGRHGLRRKPICRRIVQMQRCCAIRW